MQTVFTIKASSYVRDLLAKLTAVTRLRSKLGTKDWLLFLFKALVLYRILHKIFRFDEWHLLGTYELRAYKKEVVKIVNQLYPHVVVEIGCGLGEIISRIEAEQKIGVDTDKGVLRAARCLNWRKHVLFFDGSFDAIKTLPFSRIDSLIMINWLHTVPEKRIKMEVKRLLQHMKIRYVVVDEILNEVKGYKYHHTFGTSLGDMFAERKKVEDPEGIRRLVVLESY
jgi:SAM-dependent methyltransferase